MYLPDIGYRGYRIPDTYTGTTLSLMRFGRYPTRVPGEYSGTMVCILRLSRQYPGYPGTGMHIATISPASTTSTRGPCLASSLPCHGPKRISFGELNYIRY